MEVQERGFERVMRTVDLPVGGEHVERIDLEPRRVRPSLVLRLDGEHAAAVERIGVRVYRPGEGYPSSHRG